MHRDLTRLLVLLAVVRVLVTAACPAPVPVTVPAKHRDKDQLLRHSVTHRRPACPRSRRDAVVTFTDTFTNT